MYTNRAFVLRDIYGKSILMPIRANTASNDPILFNDVAVSIWKEAATETTAAGILQKICATYGLKLDSPEAASIEHFIAQLINMGLLVEIPEEA